MAALAGCAGGGRARHPSPQPRTVRAVSGDGVILL
jgi:hypothetical protein